MTLRRSNHRLLALVTLTFLTLVSPLQAWGVTGGTDALGPTLDLTEIIGQVTDTDQEADDEPRAFLLTMGQGDEVWEKFGHNAIWIHDPERGTDWVYNYGVFDFNSPGYWNRFVRGNWIYQLAVFDIYTTLLEYQYRDRTVIAQELNLSREEFEELREFLEWNAQPENAEYLYDYYRDNCSTRVRDLIDMVTGGALYEATGETPSGTTYRWHSYRLVDGDLPVHTGLAIGLGPSADRPITVWEEMFLPGALMERVREIEIPGPDGEPVPLVRGEQILYEARGRAAEAAEPSSLILHYLIAGLLIGGAFLAVGGHLGYHESAERVEDDEYRGPTILTRLAQVGLVILGVGWALSSGAAGILLTGLWAFTNHSIAHRNLNLFQLDPLAIVLVVTIPALLFGAQWARRPSELLTRVIAAGSVFGALLQLTPWFSQGNGEIIALAVPANLGLAGAVYLLRRYRYGPRADTGVDSPGYQRSVPASR